MTLGSLLDRVDAALDVVAGNVAVALSPYVCEAHGAVVERHLARHGRWWRRGFAAVFWGGSAYVLAYMASEDARWLALIGVMVAVLVVPLLFGLGAWRRGVWVVAAVKSRTGTAGHGTLVEYLKAFWRPRRYSAAKRWLRLVSEPVDQYRMAGLPYVSPAALIRVMQRGVNPNEVWAAVRAGLTEPELLAHFSRKRVLNRRTVVLMGALTGIGDPR